MKETKHRNVVQLFPTERRKGNFKGTRDQSVKGARGWRADFAAGPAGGRRPQSRGRGREKSAAAHLELRNAWRHLYAPRMTQTFFKELNSLPLMRIPQGAPPPRPGANTCVQPREHVPGLTSQNVPTCGAAGWWLSGPLRPPRGDSGGSSRAIQGSGRGV